MKKNIKKIFMMIIFLLIFILSCIANGMWGNPVSKIIASNSGKEYINKKYSDLDLEFDNARYSFKDGNYHIYVTSPTSKDTNFSITITPFGEVIHDYYESDVLGKYNTYRRVDLEYGDKVKMIMDKKDFLYKNDIYFGEIINKEALEYEDYNNISYGVELDKLEIDKDYDIDELGKKAGHIVFYAKDKEISVEKASEILLYVKNRLDDEKISFYAIDFTLEKNDRKEGKVNSEDDSINIKHFLYEDIYEENLEERVSEAINITKDYYKKLDLEKKKQEEESEYNK
ncbi:MAG: hypothetical protein ACRDD7_02695 [Peptostreptococcaceae bacterium]